MPLHGKNILGNSLSAEGSETFEALDPSTSRRLPTRFHNATQAEVDRALDLAGRAFHAHQPGDPGQRAMLLERTADEIEAAGGELIERGAAETGLTTGRLKMELARTTGQLRLFAQVAREGSWVDARIDRPQPERKPVPKPDTRRMLIPIGPVAVFCSSNFPLAFSTAGGDTASAFAAGCPAIVKARPSHPGTAELVGMAVQRACAATGMPEGWFSMLHGPGKTTGTYLVRHPAVKAVGFTGSLSGGRALFDAAAGRPHPIPVYAEMGSMNPVFLLPGALAERAEQIAEGLHGSLTLGVGQFCTNPGLVVAIDGDNLTRCLGKLNRLVEDTPPGTMLMPPILESYEAGAARLGNSPGVDTAAQSGQTPDRAKTEAAAAVFVTDAERFLADENLRAEVFGPATLVVRCRDAQQMLQVARSLEGQLTGTFHAAEGELDRYAELVSVVQTKVGRLLYGGFPTGVEVCASMNHGGPYPATTDAHFTSVGTAAIFRFARPICYQNFPQDRLPPELRDRNVRGIWRLVDNALTKDAPAS